MMVTYDLSVDADSTTLVLKGRKASRLGVSPLALTAVHSSAKADEANDGERIVALGLSERMSVVFESKGRVDFSSVSKRVSTLQAIRWNMT
jgi:DNA damage-binding protein 1